MSHDQLGPIAALVRAWSATAEVCLKHAHDPDNGLSPTAKAIFAGRSDAYQNCADTVRLLVTLIRGPATPELQRELDAALAATEGNTSP